MSLDTWLNGWQVSGTVFWHSGVPFSVLSTPYSANGNGIVQGSVPQFASLVPGVDPYCRHLQHPGRYPARHDSMAQSKCICFSSRSCYGNLQRRQLWAPNCQFGDLGRNALRGPNFFWSELFTSRKWFPLSEANEARFDTQFFNVFNHPNFALPSIVLAGVKKNFPGKAFHSTGFGALTYHNLTTHRLPSRVDWEADSRLAD